MPLHHIIQHDTNTKILIWKITETLHELQTQVVLKPSTVDRISTMKSEIHKCAFLAVRKLLQEINLSDANLHYDLLGKPHLKTNNVTPLEISITHSHQFAAIIVSSQKVGIDIELQRDKIIKIADKFSVEQIFLNVKQNYIKKLTVIWGAKESIFKIKNHKGISFKNHIIVNPFHLNNKKTTAVLNFNKTEELFEIYFTEIENYTLVYAMPKT
ncbi:MAG: 4'-phosphopantetheinyl transferase superfamily protein [Flavobacterium sp.]|nr:4'-phosphopantetheinyl transferase superfamily protein [Flavobacterium sp.]